jgi:hypothetical protein
MVAKCNVLFIRSIKGKWFSYQCGASRHFYTDPLGRIPSFSSNSSK